MLRKLGRYVSFVLIVILMPTSKEVVAAEAESKFFYGANPSRIKIAGDFNGTDGPKVEPGFVIFNPFIGYRLTRAFSVQGGLEFDSFLIFPATGSYSGINNTRVSKQSLDYSAYTLTAKYNFLLDSNFQPFVKGGILRSSLIFDGDNDDGKSKQKLSGNGYGIGLGVEYFFGKPNEAQPSIALGYSKRRVSYEGKLYKSVGTGASTGIVTFQNPFTKTSFNGDIDVIEISFRFMF